MSLVSPGYYPARAVRIADERGDEVYAQFGRSSQKGTDQVAVVFEILEGEFEGRRLTWFGFFTEKTFERTIESLRHCGFHGDDLMQLNNQQLDQTVSIQVKHEEDHEFNTKARIAWVNAPGGGGVVLKHPLTHDEFRHFAAGMRAKIAGMKGGRRVGQSRGSSAPASGRGRNEPPPPDDDDIPF